MNQGFQVRQREPQISRLVPHLCYVLEIILILNQLMFHVITLSEIALRTKSIMGKIVILIKENGALKSHPKIRQLSAGKKDKVPKNFFCYVL